MKSAGLILFVLLSFPLLAQIDEYNIVNRDSFPGFVKKVTVNAYLANDQERKEPMSSRYYELDTTGAWVVRIETFSDGDVSHDSVVWNPKTRTKKIIHSNDFEPGVVTVVYNADGTVKRISSDPKQRDGQLTEYEYDKEKHVVKKTTTFVENRTVEVYTYDAIGRTTGMKRSSGSVTAKKLTLDYEAKCDYGMQGDDYVVYGLYYSAGETVRSRDTTFMVFNESHKLSQQIEILDNGARKKITVYEYDESGRVIHCMEQTIQNGEDHASNMNMEYDSLGYYSVYVSEGSTYGYSNRWTTQYNERGLPEQSYFETEAEIFVYVWTYEYR